MQLALVYITKYGTSFLPPWHWLAHICMQSRPCKNQGRKVATLTARTRCRRYMQHMHPQLEDGRTTPSRFAWVTVALCRLSFAVADDQEQWLRKCVAGVGGDWRAAADGVSMQWAAGIQYIHEHLPPGLAPPTLYYVSVCVVGGACMWRYMLAHVPAAYGATPA